MPSLSILLTSALLAHAQAPVDTPPGAPPLGVSAPGSAEGAPPLGQAATGAAPGGGADDLNAVDGTRGIVIRATGTTASSVTVTLTPPSGPAVETALRDDGSSPDVGARDGVYAGVVRSEADRFKVTVVSDGARFAAGDVSWDGVAARDLELTFSDGKVVAKALANKAPANQAPVNQPRPVATSGADGAASSSVGPGAGSPAPGVPTVAVPPPAPELGGGESDSLGVSMILGGGALLLLAGLGWVWAQGARPLKLPKGVERVPPAGFAGDGTPALGQVSTALVVDAEHVASFVHDLVRTLARTRPLLVASERALRPVVTDGAAVFAMDASDRDDVGDAADALHERFPALGVVLVLSAGPDADAFAEALSAHVDRLIVASEAPAAMPSLRVTPTEAGWVVAGDVAVPLVRGPYGLVRADGALLS